MRPSRLLLCMPLFVLACSEGSKEPGNGGSAGGDVGDGIGGGSQTGGAAGNAGAANGGQGGNQSYSSAGGSGGGGSSAIATCPAPIDIGVRIVGRHDGCAADGVRIRWSGTGFVGAFTGTGVSIRLRESAQANYYTVLIDGVLGNTLITAANEGTYVLGTNLTAGAHVVQMLRRTEASFGITTLLELKVEGGQLETPPAAPTRFLEVVGDSISCGYGNEGETAGCSFTAATENHYLSYGSLLARRFEAEVSTVAWSGKGVVSNYGGDTVSNRIPDLYDRAITGDLKSAWDFSVKPQAVILNLGTNDYSGTSDPTDADFTAAYAKLLTTIRGHYPDAYILCTNGPMLSGTDLTTARKNIAAAVAERVATGDEQVEAYELQAGNESPGCDWHPDLTAHQVIADELSVKLQAKLGW